MLKSYFAIIRNALSENRQKGLGVYYEAHHIVPECLEVFGKKSSTVLLTAREHYKVHKILADIFKDHPLYCNKMLWAFHRMTYSGDLQLSEEEYAVAREALMKLWKRKKSKEHRDNIGKSHKGKRWVLNPTTDEFIQIEDRELDSYISKGWINTNKILGQKRSEEVRLKYSISATKSKLGKVGEQSRATKGTVICENLLTGEKVEAGSALQLANKLGMNCNIFHEELNRSNYSNNPKPRSKKSKYYDFLQTHKIYYKQ
jgi:hypothetical protein